MQVMQVKFSKKTNETIQYQILELIIHNTVKQEQSLKKLLDK